VKDKKKDKKARAYKNNHKREERGERGAHGAEQHSRRHHGLNLATLLGLI